MVPISVSDILKILDQIPIWKAVSGLPKRIAELERKVAELETNGRARSAAVPSAKICPICDATMKVRSEVADPLFGDMGVKIHHMECEECGHKADRRFDGTKYT